eukprot:953589-Pleurochrysis_carterae.AAC.1
MRRPCPDQKICAQLAHSSSGPCLLLQLGPIGWPLLLSGREIRALLPEGPSTNCPSPPAGERHDEATRRMRRSCPDQKIHAQLTHSSSGP